MAAGARSSHEKTLLPRHSQLKELSCFCSLGLSSIHSFRKSFRATRSSLPRKACSSGGLFTDSQAKGVSHKTVDLGLSGSVVLTSFLPAAASLHTGTSESSLCHKLSLCSSSWSTRAPKFLLQTPFARHLGFVSYPIAWLGSEKRDCHFISHSRPRKRVDGAPCLRHSRHESYLAVRWSVNCPWTSSMPGMRIMLLTDKHHYMCHSKSPKIVTHFPFA